MFLFRLDGQNAANRGKSVLLEKTNFYDSCTFYLPRQGIERMFLLRLVGQPAAIGKNPTTEILLLRQVRAKCGKTCPMCKIVFTYHGRIASGDLLRQNAAERDISLR